MPIELEAGNNVRSFEIELSYDPDVLLFNSISWDESIGGMSIVDHQEDGLIKATAAGLESITSGNTKTKGITTTSSSSSSGQTCNSL